MVLVGPLVPGGLVPWLSPGSVTRMGLLPLGMGCTVGNVDWRPALVVVRAEEAGMRMTVRVVLGAVTAVLGTLLLVGIAAGPALAASGPVVGSGLVVASGPAGAAAAPYGVVGGWHLAAAAPTTTAAPATGTNYNQGQQAANSALAKRKLIMAGICVVLLVIVYFGHRAKYKHILRVKNLQNAKS